MVTYANTKYCVISDAISDIMLNERNAPHPRQNVRTGFRQCCPAQYAAVAQQGHHDSTHITSNI